MFENLNLNFDVTGNGTKYSQLARAIKKYLADNRVPPSTRLPGE